MNTLVRVILGIIAVATLCAIGLFLGYHLGCDPVLHEAAQQGDAMAWIKHEYHLNPEQFKKIEQLHAQYSGTCDEHCRNIQMAMKARDELLTATPRNETAITAANEHISSLSTHCEATLKRHLEQVAALMSPEDGSRYLATMIPLLERFNHSGAPDLRLTSPSPAHEHRK